MSLDTIISSALVSRRETAPALVLMGGGARTAYQAGVLRALGAMLSLNGMPQFPFKILVGTSAGALNCAFLASRATAGITSLGLLADFWLSLRSQKVYRLAGPGWMGASRWLTALNLALRVRDTGSILDGMPMVDSLHQAISLPAIEAALASGAIQTLAVTASSYATGLHWTFCQQAQAAPLPLARPGRRYAYEQLTIEHLAASSAIPFVFPSVALWAKGRREFFGDGSMRQVSPLSPAMHLGATHILAIGAGQPERPGLGLESSTLVQSFGKPSLGQIAGHALASVFHDTLMADVEQTRRVNTTLAQLQPEVRAALPYKKIEVVALSPSRSLDDLAIAHLTELPKPVVRMLGSLGALNGGGAALASYLLFEPGFVQALIDLGEQDAFARKDELLAFFRQAQTPVSVMR